MLSCCHDVMMSWCHDVLISWYHDGMLLWHGVMLSWCHTVMLSCCHDIMMSCCHVVMLLCCHDAMLTWSHGVPIYFVAVSRKVPPPPPSQIHTYIMLSWSLEMQRCRLQMQRHVDAFGSPNWYHNFEVPDDTGFRWWELIQMLVLKTEWLCILFRWWEWYSTV